MASNHGLIRQSLPALPIIRLKEIETSTVLGPFKYVKLFIQKTTSLILVAFGGNFHKIL